jgi:glycerophosphoryl diester phosphodiesterase
VISLSILKINTKYNFLYNEMLCRYRPYLQEHNLRGKELVSEAHKLGLMVHTWTFTNSREDGTIKQYFEGSEIKG